MRKSQSGVAARVYFLAAKKGGNERSPPSESKRQDLIASNEVLSFTKARRTGLEPATSGSTGRYSNQLSYRPNWGTGFYHGRVFGQGVRVCQKKINR